jgi:hypothetical protein
VGGTAAGAGEGGIRYNYPEMTRLFARARIVLAWNCSETGCE